MLELFTPLNWSDENEHRRKLAEGITQITKFLNNMRYGSSVLTLDASGNGAISISPPLDEIKSVILMNGDLNATTSVVSSDPSWTGSLIPVHFRPNPGAISVRVNWLVFGQ